MLLIGCLESGENNDLNGKGGVVKAVIAFGINLSVLMITLGVLLVTEGA